MLTTTSQAAKVSQSISSFIIESPNPFVQTDMASHRCDCSRVLAELSLVVHDLMVTSSEKVVRYDAGCVQVLEHVVVID